MENDNSEKIVYKYNVTNSILHWYEEPDLLNVFLDVKTELLKNACMSDEMWDLKNNKGKKNILTSKATEIQKKWFKGTEFLDISENSSKSVVDDEVFSEIIKNLKFIFDETSTKMFVKCDYIADINYRAFRGARTFLSNINLNDGIEIDLMPSMGSFAYEKFTLTFKILDKYFAIRPENGDGIKGSGRIYVYTKNETKVYRDDLSKYVDVSELLKRFKG